MWRRFLLICFKTRRQYSIESIKLEKSLFKQVQNELKEGLEIEGFLINTVSYIPEFNMKMIKLIHGRTGCEYIHLARDDNNNVFSIAFRTTPRNSTGLPHILEHTTLCGSRKYPISDTFFKMFNRSLATFMNALRSADYTIYPFATQNRTDYKNLMSVYLDAVFRPNLKESDFKQKGWRLEHEIITDKSSPIIIKGVVFNEMKVTFFENQSLLSKALLNNILPSHTYSFISDGNPLDIPSLGYTDLKQFHKNYYRPSNCKMFSYGNFPLQDHLQFINKTYLEDYPIIDNTGIETSVPSEPRWTVERTKHIGCRYDTMLSTPSKQSSIIISCLCNDIKSIEEIFVMQVLSELLLSGPNSAFYKTMIDTNIGGGFNPIVGYNAQTRDTIFSVGLSGVDSIDFNKITDIYYNTINKIINDGFDENNIKRVLHNIELNIKHQSIDFGLNMLYTITPVWNHDGNVLKVIKVNDKVMNFKQILADNPLYLQDFIKKYLKDNKHRLILTMSPEIDFEQKQINNEINLLKKKLSNLTENQIEAIYYQGINLAKKYDEIQDVKCLPTLTIRDLNPDFERANIKGILIQNVPIQICTLPTNGLTYFRGVFSTSILSDEAKGMLPLFCNIITKMGTRLNNYRQMDQLLQLKSGGLHFNPHIAENIYDNTTFEEGIVFYTYCLDRNIKIMLSLLNEILTEVNLNNIKRFKTLINIITADLLQNIVNRAHVYAVSLASSFVSSVEKRKEQLYGLTFLQTMKELLLTTNLSDALELISGIVNVAFKKTYLRLALNTDVENEKIFPSIDQLLKSIPGKFKQPFEVSKLKILNKEIKSIHYVMPFQVSYTSLCIPTVEYTNNDYPILNVLARLLTSKYLIPKIREKGNAYSAGINLSTSGVFKFYSYRDSKPLITFDIFNEAKNWINNAKFTEQDVDEAKLNLFQLIDAPISVGEKGIRNFLFGISDDELQKQREIVMQVNKRDILRVSARLEGSMEGRALLGPKNDEVLLRTNENWGQNYRINKVFNM